MANTDHLCMGCMNPLPGGRTECGICGYPVNGENPPLYLPVRTVLSDRYLVGRVLEAGGDAALYIGFDQVQKTPILIREYLPDTLCERGESNRVRVISGCENTYQDYLERFRSHARALARMRDLPAVIPLYDIFEQNNTAYTVSEHIEGISLETRLAQTGGRMRWDEARPLFMPLLSSLISLHSAGITHFGICPENILIGGDGKLHLRGFAIPEARTVSTDLKPQLLSGYSAPEQYGFEQDYGPATDVYGMAATIFRTLTGNPPPDGASRAKNSSDLFVPAEVAKELPDHVAAALFNALQVLPDKRTASIQQFRDQLSAAPAVTALIEAEGAAQQPPAEEEEPEPPAKPKNKRTKYVLLIVLAAFIVMLLAAGAVILLLFPDLLKGGETSSIISAPPIPTQATTATTEYVPQEKKFAVADMLGKNYYDEKDNTFTGKMKLKVQAKQYSDKPAGTILFQDPAPEAGAAEGTVINVIISDGPEKLAIPDIRGWNQDQARMLLEAMGFRVEKDALMVVESQYERGMVDETSPPIGTTLERGDSIILRVSDKEPPTEPPTTTTTEQNSPWDWFR